MATKPLSPQQQRFVTEYLKDRNATQAYIRAGYKGTGVSGRTAAAKLLTNVYIKAEIDKATAAVRKQAEQATGITLERTLKELGRLAFFDPRRLFNDDGSPKGIHDLDDDTAMAIQGLDVASIGNAEVGVGAVLKYKLADKRSSLDMLMKHLGGYERDNAQKVDPVAALLKAMTRSSLPVAKDAPDEGAEGR